MQTWGTTPTVRNDGYSEERWRWGTRNDGDEERWRWGTRNDGGEERWRWGTMAERWRWGTMAVRNGAVSWESEMRCENEGRKRKDEFLGFDGKCQKYPCFVFKTKDNLVFSLTIHSGSKPLCIVAPLLDVINYSRNSLN